MKILFGKFYSFPPAITNNNLLKGFVVTVASSSGDLNSKTGYIIEPTELDQIVQTVLERNILEENNIFSVPKLEYLPHTLEIIASRLYDWLDDELPYNVIVEEVKVLHQSEFFVKYGRDAKQMYREPQPQPKPQQKFRKRRKKK